MPPNADRLLGGVGAPNLWALRARRASSTDFASGRDIEEICCDDDVGAWYVARCRDAADGTREVVLRTNGAAILGQGLHLERSQLTAR